MAITYETCRCGHGANRHHGMGHGACGEPNCRCERFRSGIGLADDLADVGEIVGKSVSVSA